MKLAAPLTAYQVRKYRYVLVTNEGEISQASNDLGEIDRDLEMADRFYPNGFHVIDRLTCPNVFDALQALLRARKLEQEGDSFRAAAAVRSAENVLILGGYSL